jgi:hypothetical protein
VTVCTAIEPLWVWRAGSRPLGACRMQLPPLGSLYTLQSEKHFSGN